ncbi:MAG: cytochrome c peroxidase [Candidatus Obscuribacterales bacterium]
MAKVSKRVLLSGAGVCVLLGLLLPISNFFLPRDQIKVEGGTPEFAAASKVLQKKCADCHSPDMTSYPIYFNLPIANQLIKEDIEEAQEHVTFSRAKLSGTEKFSTVAQAKIYSVIDSGEMPPAKYTLMHWDAGITQSDKDAVLAWIKSEGKSIGVEAIPEDKNPFDPDTRKAALGKKLFHDKRLSGDDTVSCASCHALDKGGTDHLRTSTGIKGQKGPINAPTVFNSAYNLAQFWDGRSPDLADQVSGPVENPVEMGSNWEQVMSKLKEDSEYQKEFAGLYPEGMNAKSIADAIASFEKTLITPGSAFDRFLAGDLKALKKDERKGYDLFVKNQCVTCHIGPALGGKSYERMGVKGDYFAWRGKPTQADLGRYNFTKKEEDKHKFKVPTLRNVALTWPYFHDGSTSDLGEAVKIMAKYQNGVDLSDDDTGLIVKFLNSLTGQYEGKILTTADKPN